MARGGVTALFSLFFGGRAKAACGRPEAKAACGRENGGISGANRFEPAKIERTMKANRRGISSLARKLHPTGPFQSTSPLSSSFPLAGERR